MVSFNYFEAFKNQNTDELLNCVLLVRDYGVLEFYLYC